MAVKTEVDAPGPAGLCQSPNHIGGMVRLGKNSLSPLCLQGQPLLLQEIHHIKIGKLKETIDKYKEKLEEKKKKKKELEEYERRPRNRRSE